MLCVYTGFNSCHHVMCTIPCLNITRNNIRINIRNNMNIRKILKICSQYVRYRYMTWNRHLMHLIKGYFFLGLWLGLSRWWLWLVSLYSNRQYNKKLTYHQKIQLYSAVWLRLNDIQMYEGKVILKCRNAYNFCYFY